jgi:hypothetical protein
MQSENPQLDPGAILQTAFAFWSSKVLLTAVEFALFTKLGKRRITGAELGAELCLHPRSISDFFDALVAMKFLDREGDGATAKYFNTPAGALYRKASGRSCQNLKRRSLSMARIPPT